MFFKKIICYVLLIVYLFSSLSYAHELAPPFAEGVRISEPYQGFPSISYEIKAEEKQKTKNWYMSYFKAKKYNKCNKQNILKSLIIWYDKEKNHIYIISFNQLDDKINVVVDTKKVTDAEKVLYLKAGSHSPITEDCFK